MGLHESNEELAVQHMRKLVSAAMNFQRTPIQRLKDDAALAARVEARVIKGLAEQSGDPSLIWAANEAALVVRNIINRDCILQGKCNECPPEWRGKCGK